MRGPLHPSTGNEAVAIGECANLKRTDLIASTHRGRGRTIAKWVSVERILCERFGRASGYIMIDGKDIIAVINSGVRELEVGGTQVLSAPFINVSRDRIESIVPGHGGRACKCWS